MEFINSSFETFYDNFSGVLMSRELPWGHALYICFLLALPFLHPTILAAQKWRVRLPLLLPTAIHLSWEIGKIYCEDPWLSLLDRVVGFVILFIAIPAMCLGWSLLWPFLAWYYRRRTPSRDNPPSPQRRRLPSPPSSPPPGTKSPRPPLKTVKRIPFVPEPPPPPHPYIRSRPKGIFDDCAEHKRGNERVFLHGQWRYVVKPETTPEVQESFTYRPPTPVARAPSPAPEPKVEDFSPVIAEAAPEVSPVVTAPGPEVVVQVNTAPVSEPVIVEVPLPTVCNVAPSPPAPSPEQELDDVLRRINGSGPVLLAAADSFVKKFELRDESIREQMATLTEFFTGVKSMLAPFNGMPRVNLCDVLGDVRVILEQFYLFLRPHGNLIFVQSGDPALTEFARGVREWCDYFNIPVPEWDFSPPQAPCDHLPVPDPGASVPEPIVPTVPTFIPPLSNDVDLADVTESAIVASPVPAAGTGLDFNFSFPAPRAVEFVNSAHPAYGTVPARVPSPVPASQPAPAPVPAPPAPVQAAPPAFVVTGMSDLERVVAETEILSIRNHFINEEKTVAHYVERFGSALGVVCDHLEVQTVHKDSENVQQCLGFFGDLLDKLQKSVLEFSSQQLGTEVDQLTIEQSLEWAHGDLCTVLDRFLKLVSGSNRKNKLDRLVDRQTITAAYDKVNGAIEFWGYDGLCSEAEE